MTPCNRICLLAFIHQQHGHTSHLLMLLPCTLPALDLARCVARAAPLPAPVTLPGTRPEDALSLLHVHSLDRRNRGGHRCLRMTAADRVHSRNVVRHAGINVAVHAAVSRNNVSVRCDDACGRVERRHVGEQLLHLAVHSGHHLLRSQFGSVELCAEHRFKFVKQRLHAWPGGGHAIGFHAKHRLAVNEIES